MGKQNNLFLQAPKAFIQISFDGVQRLCQRLSWTNKNFCTWRKRNPLSSTQCLKIIQMFKTTFAYLLITIRFLFINVFYIEASKNCTNVVIFSHLNMQWYRTTFVQSKEEAGPKCENHTMEVRAVYSTLYTLIFILNHKNGTRQHYCCKQWSSPLVDSLGAAIC